MCIVFVPVPNELGPTMAFLTGSHVADIAPIQYHAVYLGKNTYIYNIYIYVYIVISMYNYNMHYVYNFVCNWNMYHICRVAFFASLVAPFGGFFASGN